MSYRDVLKKLAFTTFEDRRKGEEIMLFYYVTGRVKLYKDDFIILNTRMTRGQRKELKVKRDDKEVWSHLQKNVVCQKISSTEKVIR